MWQERDSEVIEQSSLSWKWPHSWIDAQKLQNDVHALQQEPVHARMQRHTRQLSSRASCTVGICPVGSHIYARRPCVACAVHLQLAGPSTCHVLLVHAHRCPHAFRPAIPMHPEPTAPPLPVLCCLHHVRPPAGHCPFCTCCPASATHIIPCPCCASCVPLSRWCHPLVAPPVIKPCFGHPHTS